jgi:hypothetical protein
MKILGSTGRRSCRAGAALLIAAALLSTGRAGAADDATLAVAPLAASVPIAPADVAGNGVIFRPVEGGVLNRYNSALPPAPDEGLWRESRGLPIGARIHLHVAAAKAPADGHSALHLKLQLFDEQGLRIERPTRVRIETSLGRLRTPGGIEGAAFDLAVPAGQAELDLLAPVDPGEARVRASSGAVRVEGRLHFVPELRPLIAVGIADLGFTAQHMGQDPGAPGATRLGFEDSLQHWGGAGDPNSFWSTEGRVAGFVKGAIDDDTLLTASVDTNKVDPQRFFADIDPNQFFPVSGDASLVNYDARSTSKVYLRLDREEGHLLYGDFRTLAPGEPAWLGSYVRTLTGLTVHYETPQTRADVFGALQASHQFVDEQPGRGISGPYAVSQANAIANSELIELLVRDRNQPAVVLSRQVLTRYADYDFEPFSGRILFRQPVPSVDENLNPISIRITYEVDNGGPRYWVDGGNVERKLREDLSVGARYAEDHDPLTPYRLLGANAVWQADAHTKVTVDAARSEGNELYSNAAGTGLTPVAAAAGLLDSDPSGNAGRIELVRHDELLDLRAYAAHADLSFENANAGLSPGRTEEGVKASLRLSERSQLVVEAEHSADATTAAHRDDASAGVETQVWSGGKLLVGMCYVNQTYNAALPAVAQYAVGAVPGTSSGATLNNTGFGFLGGGLLGSPLAGALALPAAGAQLVEQDYLSARARLTQKIGEQASVYGEYEHTLDGTSGQRAAVGGEVRLDAASRVYARYEDIDSLTGVYGLGDGTRAHQAVVGVDTAYMRDGTVYSEYRIAGTESGQSAANAIGVRNRWQLAPGWNATTAVERQEVIGAAPLADAPAGSLTGTQSATALALGLDYAGSPLWKGAGRLEYRYSDVQDTWLSTLALIRKLSDDWSLIGRNVYLSARTLDPALQTGNQEQDRLQLGAAYRDNTTNRWNVLARYELRTDLNTAPLDAADSHTQILALMANVHPLRAWTYEGQVAAKRVVQTLDGAGADYDERLFAGRVLWDLAPRWDLGVLASTTTGGGARDQGVGLEAGYRVFQDFWVSVGTIAGRYADTELFSANSSWRGVYVHLRFKFDETSFRRAAAPAPAAP